MKKYLCIEDGEHFIVEAKDWEEAHQLGLVESDVE